jgi:hypothetical protein
LENPSQGNIDTITSFLQNKHKKIVNKFDLSALLAEENKIASQKGIENFKFATNEDMFSAIEQNRVTIIPST